MLHGICNGSFNTFRSLVLYGFDAAVIGSSLRLDPRRRPREVLGYMQRKIWTICISPLCQFMDHPVGAIWNLSGKVSYGPIGNFDVPHKALVQS